MIQPRTGTIALAIAAGVFAFPLYTFVRWATVYSESRAFEANVQAFLSISPPSIRSPGTITLISVACCAVTVLAAALAVRRLAPPLRHVAGSLAGLGAMLGVWNLFTLM